MNFLKKLLRWIKRRPKVYDITPIVICRGLERTDETLTSLGEEEKCLNRS